MSLLERKKKQWEEERAFLAGAGTGLWGVTNDASSKPNRKENVSKKNTGATDAPREDALKLQQEQQRLALQLQKQEMLEKQLKGQENQKRILQEQYQNQQGIRIDSKQIPLHIQDTSERTSSSPICGVTIPDDYFNRGRLIKQNNSQTSISSNLSQRNRPPEPSIKHTNRTPASLSHSDTFYDRSLPVQSSSQHSNANVYSIQAYQMQTSQPYPEQFQQQFSHPQYQYQPPMYIPQSSSPQQPYVPNPYHYSYHSQYQVPHQQYHSSGQPQSYPPVGGAGYGYSSPAGTTEGGVFSQSVKNATYLVPTSSGRADVLTVRGSPPAGGIGWPNSYHNQTAGKESQPGSRSRKSTESGGSRAKWGDHGVGVGHLWDPSAETNNRKDSLPPSWVEQHADNALPGAPLSQSEQRTHARGQGMAKLDPERAAERARKQKKAEETQRVIERQVAEKKRMKEEEEERDRREAELWDERIKQQQEKEAKEYQEELNRRRQKEEAEQRRQEHLQEALKKAEQKARQEKEEKKAKMISHARVTSSPTNDLQENTIAEESSTKPVQSAPHASRASKRSRKNVSERQNSALSNTQSSLGSLAESKSHHGTDTVSKNTESNETTSGVPLQNIAPQPQNIQTSSPSSAPPALSSNQFPSGGPPPTPDLIAARIKLLTALGLTPDYLVSTGLLDRQTLLSLLGVGYESKFPPAGLASAPSTAGQGSDSASPYVSDRLLTPRKYRDYRECGTQYEVSPARSRTGGSEGSGARSRRSKAATHRRGSAKDDRPQWNRHRSDRPYRKQSEKDLALSRRTRRKQLNRSLSASGGDTEESDAVSGTDGAPAPLPPRPLRRTWDQSMQESMSSDQSRSPSPSEDSNLQRSHSRSTPVIKSLITPVYKDHRRSRKSTHLLSRSLQSLQKSRDAQNSSPTSSPTRSPNMVVRSRKQAGKTKTLKPAQEEDEAQAKGVAKDDSEETKNESLAIKDEVADPTTESSGKENLDNVNANEGEASSPGIENELDNRSDSPPVPALMKESESFDVPEYAPGDGPPSEPYRPTLPPTAKRKPRKPYIRQPKPTSKKKVELEKTAGDAKKKVELQKSEEVEGASKEPENNKKTAGSSVSNGSARRRSRIDLTLQYYEENRPASPPVPAVQKKLNSVKAGEEPSTELPELPSSARSVGNGSLKVTEETKSASLQHLPEMPSHVLTNIPITQADKSPSRISRDSFFSNPPTPRLSNSSSSSEVLGLLSNPATPQRTDSAGRSRPNTAGTRPPTPRRLQPLETQVPESPDYPVNARNPGVDFLPGKVAERHQMTRVDVNGESRSRLETLLEEKRTTTMAAEVPHVAPELWSPNALNSRRGSLTSTTEDDRRTTMSLSSGYESGRRSSDEPSTKSSRNLKTKIEEPLVAPEKMEVLQSLSSLRQVLQNSLVQNLWRRQQDLEESRTRTPDGFS